MDEQDRHQQQAVFNEAMSIYEERDAVRQGLWKQYPPEKQLEEAKIKIERCLHALKLGRPQDVLAETPDIINYTTFAQRLIIGQLESTRKLPEGPEANIGEEQDVSDARMREEAARDRS